MSIEEFAELDHIRYFYSKYYLDNIALDEKLIVVQTEDMESSCNKIREATGLRLDHSIWANKSKYTGNFDHLQNIFRIDTELYNYLKRFPEKSVHAKSFF